MESFAVQTNSLTAKHSKKNPDILYRLTTMMSWVWRWFPLSRKGALLAFCKGKPLVTSGLPSHGVSNAMIWCFLCWTSCWTNNWVTGDFRRHMTLIFKGKLLLTGLYINRAGIMPILPVQHWFRLGFRSTDLSGRPPYWLFWHADHAKYAGTRYWGSLH